MKEGHRRANGGGEEGGSKGAMALAAAANPESREMQQGGGEGRDQKTGEQEAATCGHAALSGLELKPEEAWLS